MLGMGVPEVSRQIGVPKNRMTFERSQQAAPAISPWLLIRSLRLYFAKIPSRMSKLYSKKCFKILKTLVTLTIGADFQSFP
jgi:hypothetical protein